MRGQIAATRRVIVIERRLLDLLKHQFDLGQGARADVFAREAALAAAEQLLPPVEKALAQQRNLLTAPAGQLSADEVLQKFELASLKLPASLPVSLPSKLVDQWPDVRVAEANVACGERGSRRRHRAAAAELPGLGQRRNERPQFRPELCAGDRLLYNCRQRHRADLRRLYALSQAALDQAGAQYRATVITAFQNVADALRALQADARAMKAAVHAAETAKASLDIVEQQLKAGQVNQLAVLNAQQTYLTAVVVRVQRKANRLADTAALFVALGGGWPTTCTTPLWRECAMGDAPSEPQISRGPKI